MDEFFYEIFDDLPRQGPGTDEATIRALKSTGLQNNTVKVLDIGCGTGTQTLTLAKNISGEIIATDNYQPYLDLLTEKSKRQALNTKITSINKDMNNLDFQENEFDLIWSEGAIYIIGFRRGLKISRKICKANGFIVFSDMNWFKENPPSELKNFFTAECPWMMNVDENIKLIKDEGFELVDIITLDKEKGFVENYYLPLENRLSMLRQKYRNNHAVLNIIEETQFEVDLYKKYSDYYGYTFYIMKNTFSE